MVRCKMLNLRHLITFRRQAESSDIAERDTRYSTQPSLRNRQGNELLLYASVQVSRIV